MHKKAAGYVNALVVKHSRKKERNRDGAHTAHNRLHTSQHMVSVHEVQCTPLSALNTADPLHINSCNHTEGTNIGT